MAATMTSGRFGVSLSLLFNGTMAPPGTATTSTVPSDTRGFTQTYTRTNQYGGTAGLVNVEICQERTLNAGASETLNLFDGSLLDIFNQSGALAKILFICVQLIDNPDGSTAASSITVGNAVSDAHQLWFSAATGTYTVTGTSGTPLFQGDDAGKTVDGTHKNILVANNDGSNKATYRISATGWHT